MEAILSAHTTLESKSNLTKTLTSVQTLIDTLQRTRDAVSASPELTPLHMAKLKQPLKSSFDKIEEDLKDVNKGLNAYQKALREKFKNAALPGAANDVLANETPLVNRAVAMHLLREGKFGVARTFVREVNAAALQGQSSTPDSTQVEVGSHASWAQEFADPDEGPAQLMDVDAVAGEVFEQREDGEVLEGRGHLQRKFAEMYHILDALRNQHNLGPAIAWAREHSHELERRGSNLEFELSRLKFVELYTSSPSDSSMSDTPDDDALTGPIRALDYALTTFPTFSHRYSTPIASLMGSLLYSPSLSTSPYSALFSSPSPYDRVSESFTAEFCSLLSLSSVSPLYTAVTAGGISLPILEKVERVMAASRGQWTSVNELPVETPLPKGMQFHSVFVCPVSKEQATDLNPPMMLPCGHVIARESLEMHARGKARVKCPYCPGEFGVREGRRVYI